MSRTKITGNYIEIADVEVTADGAELNLIDGVTATTAELNIMDGVTSTAAELNILDGCTATVAELNYLDISVLGTGAASKAVVLDSGDDYVWPAAGVLTYGVLADPLTTLSATVAELNNAADVSGRVQELTASGAVTTGGQSLELNHASVIIAATVAAVIGAHDGFFLVKNTSASGTAAHTCTLTGGTWDGTNTIVTLNASNEAILVYFDSAGDGTIIENIGGVALS